MKKIFILVVLNMIGCSGKHLEWVANNERPKEIGISKPVLLDDISGVIFTFDDGPDLAKTPKILDVLKKYNLRATFFVEGINLAGDSEQAKERRLLLKRMHDDGHIIGNHTFDHKDLCRLSPEKAAWELDTTDALIKSIIHEPEYKVTLVRPPYGKKCKMLTSILNKKNLSPLYWQIDPREWEKDPYTHRVKDANQVIETIMRQYHQLHDEQGLGKMVIILHDTKQVTVELIPILLEKLSHETQK